MEDTSSCSNSEMVPSGWIYLSPSLSLSVFFFLLQHRISLFISLDFVSLYFVLVLASKLCFRAPCYLGQLGSFLLY